MKRLLGEIKKCDHCGPHLPLGPRPVMAASARSRIVIIGQAPGTKVHRSGKPWDDASGDNLRRWMGIDAASFYNPERCAHLPMGFCYPGRKQGGDAPPRPECAPLWHPRVLESLRELRLVLLVGLYAQKRYLGKARERTLWQTVQNHRAYGGQVLPLPHPSWRSRLFEKKHAFFSGDVLPELRRLTAAALADDSPLPPVQLPVPNGAKEQTALACR